MRSVNLIHCLASYHKARRTVIRTGCAIFLVAPLWGASPPDVDASSISESPVETNLFRIGFSSKILIGFNENDAKAAVKTWVKMIGEENGAKADPNPEIYHDTASIAERIRQKKVDAVTMTMADYWAIHNEVKFSRLVCSARQQGQIMEEYLLLARKDSKIQNLGDLRGRSLLFLESPNMSLARIWLDTLLMEQGLKTAPEFCERIIGNTRLAKVVLPVFFHQTDACIVTRAGFETLGELNPQLTEQMRVLASSVPLLASASFFRADCPTQKIDQMVEQLSRIHATSAGQQVLTVFQTDRIIEIQPKEISSATELLARHQALCEAANKGQPRSYPISTNNPKAKKNITDK